MKDLFPFYTIGHFINEPTNRTEFEIMWFDEMDEPNVDDIHKHTFYEILWTEKGISKQTIDLISNEQKRADKSQTITQSLLHILLAQKLKNHF